MDGKELFRIHVNIAGETLPLNVPRQEEEIYRQAEKLLNQKVNRYERSHPTISRAQILILAAYDVAVGLSRRNVAVDAAPLIERIKGFTQEIDDVL